MIKATLAGLVLLLFAPATLLLGATAVLSPGAQAACLPSGGLVVEHVPRQLSADRSDGVNVTLNDAQLTNAATILSVGAGTDGVGRRGIVVALMAALTESGLRMLSNAASYPQSTSYPHDGDGGDHDSLGMFQMRPSAGWGAIADLMDPEYEAEAFFGGPTGPTGPTGPNHGSPRGLLDIADWSDLTEGQAAQAVEVSAYPDRYAAFAPVAEAILTAMATPTTSGSCGSSTAATNVAGPSGPDDSGGTTLLPPPGFAADLITAAQTQLGRPYVWGGGTYGGPSGRGSDGRGPGFDCSGLVLYAAYQASHGALRLPHYTGAQITYGHAVAWADKAPGDLIFFTEPGASAPHHVAIYLGDSQILQAPRTGENVREGTLGEFAGQTMAVRRLSG